MTGALRGGAGERQLGEQQPILGHARVERAQMHQARTSTPAAATIVTASATLGEHERAPAPRRRGGAAAPWPSAVHDRSAADERRGGTPSRRSSAASAGARGDDAGITAPTPIEVRPAGSAASRTRTPHQPRAARSRRRPRSDERFAARPVAPSGPTRSEGRVDGELGTPAFGAHQLQVGHVGTGDDCSTSPNRATGAPRAAGARHRRWRPRSCGRWRRSHRFAGAHVRLEMTQQCLQRRRRLHPSSPRGAAAQPDDLAAGGVAEDGLDGVRCGSGARAERQAGSRGHSASRRRFVKRRPPSVTRRPRIAGEAA